MDPFRRHDGKGGWLEVREVREGDPAGAEGCVITTGTSGFVAEPLMDIPAIARWMYQACGQEPAVMLGRPEINPDRPVTVGQFQVWKEPDGRIGFMPADTEAASMTGALRLAPHAVRQLAAVAVAYADAAAEQEPGPAEVEDLAHAIRLGLYPDSDRIGLRPSEGDRTAARAALKWMRERGANHG